MPGRPRRGSFLRSSSKALARPFGSRMLWELDRGATRPCKLPHKHLCFTFRHSAPAGVSQACGLAIPNTGSGAGHDTLRHTTPATRPNSQELFGQSPNALKLRPLMAGERGSRGLNVPLAPALRSLF